MRGYNPVLMPSPRVLLTIDYESWFALSRRFDSLPAAERRRLDGGFARQALPPILEQLADAKASFYLVGELLDWYPDLADEIAKAGHEIGFHCQVHRPLINESLIKQDLAASAAWRKKYAVIGYRPPMINSFEEKYSLLANEGFQYASSIYAPAGTLMKKGQIYEIPASTYPFFGKPTAINAPRNMTPRLLLGGEFPYGSGLMIGLFEKLVLKLIEKELQAGRSPVLFLHPYELVQPQNWPQNILSDLIRNPLLLPFTFNKSAFLQNLIKNFPISRMDSYLAETLKESPHA